MKYENDLKLPKGFFRAVTKCKDKKAAYNAVVALSRIEVPETLFRLATTVSEILSRVAKTRDSIPKFDTDNKTNNIQIITKKGIAQYHFIEPADFDNIVLQIVEAIHKKADKLSRKYADQLIADKIQEINERIDEPDNVVTAIGSVIRSDGATIRKVQAWIDNNKKNVQEVGVEVTPKDDGETDDIQKGLDEVRSLLDGYVTKMFKNELKDKKIRCAFVSNYHVGDEQLIIAINLQDRDNAHSKEAE